MYKLYEEHVGVLSNCQQFQIADMDDGIICASRDVIFNNKWLDRYESGGYTLKKLQVNHEKTDFLGEFDNCEDMEAFMLMYATMSGEPMTYEG
ncbi:hypothetical protein VPMG_00033 [Vibrio phage VBP32]|uniref:Uncharacterized protein n=2 Tax=Stoningtonvirus VBP47 TaxID=2846606 RepID=M4T2R2_9CAUD|nr:hypothetical protein VPNG_00095 [Vibrio phage VBP47]YP_007676523.1 hypothetical protein VPMG_00033 [Vibrio phage VBP32]AGH57119.1 hypothetical protein VPNG_00095 [Vibrio phage VBP47]AGH57172.1 hypothetical protein VPMG_00033 [Vibrio phage VBP32]